MSAEFRIEGLDELNSQLKKLTESLNPDDVEPILFEGAEILAGEMQLRVRRKSGLLASAIGAKKLKRKNNNPAPAIAAVDRRKAPHAHLIERGTSHHPAYPFVRPAVDTKGDQVAKHVQDGISKLIDKAVL